MQHQCGARSSEKGGPLQRAPIWRACASGAAMPVSSSAVIRSSLRLVERARRPSARRGRSRGGLITKVHLAVDGRGLALSIVLTPGNVNDATAFGQVLEGIRVPRAATARPHTTPTRVLGDGPTPAGRSGTCCDIGAPPSRSPSAATMRPTAGAEGSTAAGRPSSTRRSSVTATWSNYALPASSNSARPTGTRSQVTNPTHARHNLDGTAWVETRERIHHDCSKLGD